MKMEIKHLAPYLPYDLKVVFEDDEHEHTLVGLVNWSNEIMVLSPFSDYGRSNIKNCKPILRPLSDLTKEIEHKGVKIIPIDYFEIGDDYNDIVDYGQGNVKLIGLLKDMAEHNFIQISYMNYGVIIKLFEWHFDVFGLIEKGLALDINELKH